MILPAMMGCGLAPVAMVSSFIAGSRGIQGEDRLRSPANPDRILKRRDIVLQIAINHPPRVHDVRFTPESGYGSARSLCPLCAVSGHSVFFFP
jgi:hypothetical protein